jgi:aminoglycoside phosphotransferase (APT) family kinase protein
MGRRLAAALGGPATCHVLDAKFEPGVRATVLYDLAGRLVRGDLLDAGQSDQDGGSGRVVEPHLRVRVFPDDPDLPALRRMTDPASLAPALAGLQGASGRGDPVRCRIRLLRYRPGKRATVHAVVTPSRPALVMKAYHSDAKATAVADEASALFALPEPGGVLRFAPPAGHLPGWRVVAQEAVGGTALDAILTGRGSPRSRALTGVRSAGRALAELHALPSVTRRNRPVEAELHRFRTRADRLSVLDPCFAAVAARVADLLLERHEALPAGRFGPVHGDCKPSQFLLVDDHVHLLDLDHYGICDQAADVGTFLATLRQLAVRRRLARRGTETETGPLERAFLEGYRAACGGGFDPDLERTRWQLAVALERKALRAFARAPRSPLPLALASEAARCLDARPQGGWS